MRLVRPCIATLVGSMLLSGDASAQASVQSTVSAIPTVSAALAGSIAVSVDAGAIQALGNVSDNVVNSFPSPVRITLTWDLHPSTGAVQVIGYFSDPAAAMISGPELIPSSWLKGRVLTAGVQGAPTTFTAFTQNAVGVAAGAVQTLGSVSDNAVNSFPSAVSITLTWDLPPSTGAVQVIGYFSDPAAAMISGPELIPASWLKGRVLTAGVQGAPTAFTAFTQNAVGGVGIPGGSLSLATQPVLGYSKTGTLTFDLDLQLDLTGRVLAAGTYGGVLNIRAVTQ